jgi:threonine/homoserine/homoserine lactone efflux protein
LQVRYWGTWVSVILHAAGMLLFCYIGEQARAKTFLIFALGCFLAYVAWDLLLYFESLEERKNNPIPPSVQFMAQLTWIVSPLFLMIALRRVSLYCHDRQMQRWSFVALLLYAVMAILEAGVIALYFLAPGLLEDFVLKFKLEHFRIYELTSYAVMLIGVPVAYCYGRILRRVAVLWEQVPAEEMIPSTESTNTPSDFQG